MHMQRAQVLCDSPERDSGGEDGGVGVHAIVLYNKSYILRGKK